MQEAFDETGRVRIYVRLLDPQGKFVAGNVTRSFTFLDARVSDVADAIRKALVDA